MNSYAALENWREEDFLRRLELLKDETSTSMVLNQIAMLLETGNEEGITRTAENVRARLFDLSAFMTAKRESAW